MFKREWILPEQGYEAALKALEGELAPYRTEGYFTAPDGAPLYYERVYREENRKAILLLHGFTEFIGKYTEMIGCFFRDGYDVYIFEQRGHGRSARAVENAQLVHVDAFSSYVRDTAAFVRRVIAPENYEALDLFSHSMGGAVAALYLAGDGCPVRRAVLSAPMIAPRSGKAPRPLVLWHLRRQGKKRDFPLLALMRGILIRTPHLPTAATTAPRALRRICGCGARTSAFRPQRAASAGRLRQSACRAKS